jgi:Domain of unknown function (DUF4209)
MIFETLAGYYSYMENDAALIDDVNVSAALINLRDKQADENAKEHCSFELFFNDFTIMEGTFIPIATSAGGETYPSHSLFTDEMSYIKFRAETIINPKYKARYYHLLWLSKAKHNEYAKNAIDNYIIQLQNAVLLPENNRTHLAFTNIFKNLFLLSQGSNYKQKDTLLTVTSFLGRNKFNEYQECALIWFISENSKKVDKALIQTFFDYCNKVINENLYPDANKEYLELLVYLCSKINLPSKNYQNMLGAHYLKLAEKQKESFISHDFYIKALQQYQKAGNKEKVEEVTALIANGKKSLNFKLFRYENSDELVQKLWKGLNDRYDKLSETSSAKSIYEFIILSEDIFPKANVLNEIIRPPSFDYINVMSFDINKNVSDKQMSGLSIYFNHIRNFSIEHLRLIFLKGYKHQKVSYNSLIEYLSEHTWYGEDSTSMNAEGELEGFNWITLLSPSLKNFFDQSEIDIKTNKNNFEGYILCIDSLAIKFEGLLRELSRKIGAQTIEIREHETQERISFEKLLENQKIIDLIPPDDIALFKFLFTSQGMNIRNNVAHCFYTDKAYSAGLIFLLIAALLKLGNYKAVQMT